MLAIHTISIRPPTAHGSRNLRPAKISTYGKVHKKNAERITSTNAVIKNRNTSALQSTKKQKASREKQAQGLLASNWGVESYIPNFSSRKTSKEKYRSVDESLNPTKKTRTKIGKNSAETNTGAATVQLATFWTAVVLRSQDCGTHISSLRIIRGVIRGVTQTQRCKANTGPPSSGFPLRLCILSPRF